MLKFGALAILLISLHLTLCEFEYLNEFVVELNGDLNDATALAEKHGYQLKSHIAPLGNVYVFTHNELEKGHRSKRSAENLLGNLLTEEKVLNVEQQHLLTRNKRNVLPERRKRATHHESDRRHMVYDKQVELPIRTYKDKSVYEYHENRLHSRGNLGEDNTDLVFGDPYFSHQWYLRNTGQTGGPTHNDLNIVPVWQKGFTGAGVKVCVLDDGIEHTHPDLVNNYDQRASADLNDESDSNNDPMPDETNTENNHGTRCAGEIAAEANNSYCGVGVAFGCSIGGVRMLDGPITDSTEARALLHAIDYVDVYSASWGPRDDGMTLEGPGRHAQEAFIQGVLQGRDGKGVIYVWATGNGGENHDTCSCDGYVSDIHTLSVGCASDYGLSTYYSEVCPATMAVVFTGGSHSPPTSKDFRSPSIKIVTTDIGNGCTLGFQGTSSAAPLAAGIVALTLEANPDLGWRDVQHLVVRTAKIPNGQEGGWTVNGAGYHVNPHFGFGVMDAGRMVNMAQNWVNVPEQHTCNVMSSDSDVAIQSGADLALTISTDACQDTANYTRYLEHVQMYINIDHTYRGDISLILISPSLTENMMLVNRENDNETEGIDFMFMSVHCWGENPAGDWVLHVRDNDGVRQNTGVLNSWGLIFYGTSEPPSGDAEVVVDLTDVNVVDDRAHVAPMDEIADIMADETVQRNSITIDQNDAVSDGDLPPVQSDPQPPQGGASDDTLSTLLSEWIDLQLKEKSPQQVNYNSNINNNGYNNGYYYGSQSNKRQYEAQNYYNYNRKRGYNDGYNDIERKTFDDIDDMTSQDIEKIIREIQEYLDEDK